MLLTVSLIAAMVGSRWDEQEREWLRRGGGEFIAAMLRGDEEKVVERVETPALACQLSTEVPPSAFLVSYSSRL